MLTIWLELERLVELTSIVWRDNPYMAFMRADTARTMMSRSWSTNEVSDGLEHLLQDELPDNLEELEE